MKFKDTLKMMISNDYKKRFIAEYLQTKIRYNKLKALNTRIEASYRTTCYPEGEEAKSIVEQPEHNCPAEVLREQQSIMGQYLHILEVRAVIEGIDLEEV